MLNSRKRQNLKDEYARWLKGFDWRLFITLTCKYPTRRDALVRKVQEFLLSLGPSTFAAIGLESNPVEGQHAHGLVAGTSATVRAARKEWTHGFSKIERYAASGGALAYSLKGGDVELLGAFPH